MLQRLARSRARAVEAGQSVVLVALTLPVLLGMVGLGVDFGRLAAEHRKLQNYADAAALAGAQDLSKYYRQACTDANTSLTANNNPGLVSCGVSTTTNSNDTITVTLSEPVSMDFMPVLGISSQTVRATGKAITSSLTGCNDNSSDTANLACAPYAAWRPSATSGCPDQFQPGMTVIFRDNAWAGDTGATSCSAWGTGSNDFKGYIRPNWSSKNPATCSGSDPICTGTNYITTSGGNACGQEPVTDIQNAYTNGSYLILPEFDSSSGNGSNITVHIPGFIVISLNFTYPYPNQIQSVTLNGPPTGGTFTLTYDSETTASLAYNATAAQVQTALTALSSIGANNATVTQDTNGAYIVTFGGSLTLSSLGTLTSTSSLTGGTSPAISVAQTETNSSKEGTASQESDYTCPATWYGMVVDPAVTGSTLSGIDAGGTCNSGSDSCDIRLQP